MEFSKVRVKQLLAQYGIDYLYHITSIDNLSSILQHDLLSRHQADLHKLVQIDISDPDVQRRRRHKSFNGISLQEYVPLYFNPKNPMLFVRKSLQEKIIILAVDVMILLKRDTVFTDGNAACQNTKFYQDISGITQLSWSTIRQPTWYDKSDGKRIRCAEVLVRNKIPVKHIIKILCHSEKIAKQVKDLTRKYHILVEINKSIYF